MRIALTDYSSLEEVHRAIRDLPYEGGSRRMGDALQSLVDHVFSPVIRRDHAPKVHSFNSPTDLEESLENVLKQLSKTKVKKGCSTLNFRAS